MALTFTFDPARRLIIEPGYMQTFSSAQLANTSNPADAPSARQVWWEPCYGTLMMKPLQLQPDFLNGPAQLTSGCCLRLALDYFVEAADLAGTTVFEQEVGNASNPWIFHTPATPAALGTFLPPGGIPASYSINEVANSSEAGSTTVFSAPPGDRRPGDIFLPDSVSSDLRLLASTQQPMPPNQGLFFRWYYPDPQRVPHQTIYGFAFGQYFFYCRPSLLEIWRDVSPAGDRSKWVKQYADDIFSPGALPRNIFSPTFAYGTNTLSEPPGEDRSLLVIPYRRQRLLILSNQGKGIVLTVFNNPQILPDGSDWKITRQAPIDIWALTGVCGRFQIQKVKYEAGPATVNFPPIVTEYTPVDPPAVLLKGDAHFDEVLTAAVQFPVLYTFPDSPTSNDTPPPTADGTGKTRTYGLTLTMQSTADQVFSPQFYSLEIIADPTWMDNPATPLVVNDVASEDATVMSIDLSLGTTPGDGHMTARLQDKNSYPMAPYYARSEAPVDITLNGTKVFSGYTERIEVERLRQTGAPRNLTVRGIDKWLLLETAYLRDQIDHQSEGHISVVNSIIRQAGIDTASDPPEYPTGWDAALASQYNTPLGTPGQIAENLEGTQLLGWKPQPLDTAATYLRRIQEFYSNWLMGFRSTGRFFYLPFTYFQEATVQFFAHEGMGVRTGLMPTDGGGLTVNLSAGTGAVMGAALSPGSQTVTVADNTVSHLYLTADGMLHTTTASVPDGALGLGAVTTAGGSITAVDTSPAASRQLSTSPVYREPFEDRTIEPSGNVVQVQTKYQIDLSSNKSGTFVDWASVQNPAAKNYLGRYKWFRVEVAGAFTPPQLNALAYIAFKNARGRRKRISIHADYVPGFEVGHVATVQGYGDWRMISMQAAQIKGNWHQATYLLESTERGF